jgi:hypothetical protein
MPFIGAKSVMFVRNIPARTTSSKLLLAAFRTADKFWNSVSGIETNGQAAVLVSREGIPIVLTTVDASEQSIDPNRVDPEAAQTRWGLKRSKRFKLDRLSSVVRVHHRLL